MALAWVQLASGTGAAVRVGESLDPRWRQVLALMTDDDPADHSAAPRPILTTSAGRLFDAVAALLGLRSQVSYEGQAAIELEMLTRFVPRDAAPSYPVAISRQAGSGGLDVLDPSPLVDTVLREIQHGTDRALIAAGFHQSLGRATAELAASLARRYQLDTVALSGGVFQNVRFSDIVEDALVCEGLHVLVHESVPPNDGGISVGQRCYQFVPEEYGKTFVTAGFEPLDILQAIAMLLTQAQEGRCCVENQYTRCVSEDGNPRALAILNEVFEPRPTFEWRGLGYIPNSALKLRAAFAQWDAEARFEVPGIRVADPKACQCGEVLKGAIKPWECKVFGTACTPETPIGTCMVSSEGACAAYYNFGRLHRQVAATMGAATRQPS
jgi:hypothetical protein